MAILNLPSEAADIYGQYDLVLLLHIAYFFSYLLT